MDGWMDAWRYGMECLTAIKVRMDGWMDAWRYGIACLTAVHSRMDGWMDGCMEVWHRVLDYNGHLPMSYWTQ
eukprot:1152183-Pelagomonas_calceolata.AAC.10